MAIPVTAVSANGLPVTLVDAAGLPFANILDPKIVLNPAEQAQAQINQGVYVSPDAWSKFCAIQAGAVVDFVNGRSYGGASVTDVATTRASNHLFRDAAGNVLTFAANEVRMSDLGLRYTTDDTMTLTGVLAQAIQGTAGTILIETGVSKVAGVVDIGTGPADTMLLGGVGTDLIGLGGNLTVMYNSSGAAANSGSPGNQRLTDTDIQAVALRWDGSGNVAICVGSGAVATATGGLGTRSAIYLGRRSNGAAGSGIIRSIWFFPQALTDAQLQILTRYGPTERKGKTIGDSLAASNGATGTLWPISLAASFNPPATTFAMGVGGNTTKNALDRYTNVVAGAQSDADPTRRREWVDYFWTGHNDAAVKDMIAGAKAMIGLETGERRYLILLPVQNRAGGTNLPGTTGHNLCLAKRQAIRDNFPTSRIVDIPALLAAAAPNDPYVANGWTPSVYLSDDIHLNQAGYDLVWPAVRARQIANGW